MSVTLIWASTPSFCIGCNNALPWERSREDMTWFSEHTKKAGNVLMGRKTFDSLPGGRALSERENLVASSHPSSTGESIRRRGGVVIDDLTAVLDAHARATRRELMIIGGKSIYEQALPYADRVLITLFMQEARECDTYFQPWMGANWDFEKVAAYPDRLVFLEGRRKRDQQVVFNQKEAS